jgi:twitching motility protein PilT
VARAELAAGRSLDRALEVEGVGRFRLNLYRTAGKLAAAIRVLPRQAPRLEDLHFPVALDEVVHAPHGLVIVCGPTGSGKSATLAALAQEALRHRGGVLITLEDPVEYTFDATEGGLVRQREIGRDVCDFNIGLRDALREDPDILLIGEMRDAESINLALTAAETGHLVLASLHSRSAGASVERIVDSYPPARSRSPARGRDPARQPLGGQPHPRRQDRAARQHHPVQPQRGHAAARALPGRVGAFVADHARVGVRRCQ